MFLLNLKLFLRNFKRQRSFSIIITLGLAIGITCSMLIGLWVLNELSYDRFNKNAANLYAVLETEHTPDGSQTGIETPAPLAQTLKKNYPEIKAATRVYYVRKFLFKSKEKAFNEDHVIAVDPDFLYMFDYPLISGDKNSALNNPSSVVIAKSTSEKYFGKENPVEQMFHIGDLADLKVTGVIEDPPANSHLQFGMIVPVNSRLVTFENKLNKWHPGGDFCTYILLKKGTDPELLNDKIKGILAEHIPDCKNTFSLLPVTKIHTSPEIVPPEIATVDITYIYVFAAIAILILLIAYLNFINLSIARSLNRVKEIGIKKIVGGLRKQLMLQFLTESFLFAIAAVILSLVFIELLLPKFEILIGKPLALKPFTTPLFYAGLLGITLATGLFVGFYPAMVLSSVHSLNLFRDWKNSGIKSNRLRKGLVIFQFAASILLILSTITVNKQLEFIRHKKLGYDKAHLISVPLSLDQEKFEAFRTKILENHSVVGVTEALCSPAQILTAKGNTSWTGKTSSKHLRVAWCTVYFDYVKTLGLKLIDGRTFSRDHPSDMGTWHKASFIVNEETVKQMGVKSAVGLNFELFGKKGSIIGVVKNFNYKTLRHKIEPIAFFINPFYNQTMLIRIAPAHMSKTIKYIKKNLKTFTPGQPFEYHFVSNELSSLYQSDRTLSNIFMLFSFLAIFIACLGLLSLTSFAVERRTKEIGIRKVLGASIQSLLTLLSKEFLKWVLIANVVAWPISYYIMNKWLQGFAYRINLYWWMFVLAGAIALIIALATVSIQAIKAATANPVESLRYE